MKDEQKSLVGLYMKANASLLPDGAMIYASPAVVCSLLSSSLPCFHLRTLTSKFLPPCLPVC